MRFLREQISKNHRDPAVELAAISPHLQLKISKRARRVALRVDSKHRVVHLVVPHKVNHKHAMAFAEQHKQWIRSQIAELPKPVPFKHGQIIPVFGRDREIRVFYDKTLKTTDIILNQSAILVVTNKRDPSERITRFLKDKAKEEIIRLAHEKAALSGKKIKSIHIRDTRSRWGSCGPDKNLNFSWRLIFAPKAAFDYLIAHEIAHLTHMNHGPKFWELCEELSVSYARGKKWLREEGHTLLRYGGC